MRYDYARGGISKSFLEHLTWVYNICIQAADRDCSLSDYLILCIQTQLNKRLPLVLSHIRVQPPVDVFWAADLVLWLWLYGVNKPLENSIKFEVLLLPILFLTN